MIVFFLRLCMLISVLCGLLRATHMIAEYAVNNLNTVNHEKTIPSIERQALHDLYTSTNGDDWIYQDGDLGHWNFSDPDVNPCLSSDPWQGLNCTVISTNTSSYYYHISDIMLSDYNLRGTIPESIGIYMPVISSFSLHRIMIIMMCCNVLI
jgi:hypothetical protein